MEKQNVNLYIAPKADALEICFQEIICDSTTGDAQKLNWSDNVEDGDKWN